jgi:hypothetical protein
VVTIAPSTTPAPMLKRNEADWSTCGFFDGDTGQRYLCLAWSSTDAHKQALTNYAMIAFVNQLQKQCSFAVVLHTSLVRHPSRLAMTKMLYLLMNLKQRSLSFGG